MMSCKNKTNYEIFIEELNKKSKILLGKGKRVLEYDYQLHDKV